MKKELIIPILAIGMLGALAVGGNTLAVFSDTENTNNNAFTSGSLDAELDWEETYNGELIETQELTSNPGPVFDLGDVKPGDEGEATISLHLFDNDGWIWMRFNLTKNDDVSSNEPELLVDEPENESDLFDGEIAQETRVELWYDEDGDNVFDPGEEPVLSNETCGLINTDLAITLDNSGSMDGPGNTNPEKFEAAKNGSQILVNSFNAQDQTALVSFNNTASLKQQLTDNKTALNDSIDALVADGETNLRDAIETANEELINGSNARPDAQKVIVLLSNGAATVGGDPVPAADDAKADGIRIITIAYGDDANAQQLANIASEGDAYTAGIDNVEDIFASISTEICTPTSLEDTANALEDGIQLDGDRDQEGIQAFENSTTQYIGFSWELPFDTGNIVQTDSALFDMDFYAEQERNNPESENPWN